MTPEQLKQELQKLPQNLQERFYHNLKEKVSQNLQLTQKQDSQQKSMQEKSMEETKMMPSTKPTKSSFGENFVEKARNIFKIKRNNK
jgi:hypothetical protein